MKIPKFYLESWPSGVSNVGALIATWFGAGLVRPAPGTIGSLAAIPLGYYINTRVETFQLMTAAFILFAISWSAVMEYGKKSGKVDDQSIVVDEVIGIWIAGSAAGTNPWLWALAFLLFRLFDITKPWPASFFDRKVKNCVGVIMDDIVAGIYALFGVAIAAQIVQSLPQQLMQITAGVAG